MDAVFATDTKGQTYRVSDPSTYGEALAEWDRLDDLRRAGHLPHVRHFEVRTVELGPDRPLVGPEVRSHGRYDRAPLNLTLTRPVASTRGFSKPEAAARAAWKLFAPVYRTRWDRDTGHAPSGVQGRGGWFYYPNGQTAAQGLHNLARLARLRGLVVEANGRYYPVTVEDLDRKVVA